MFFNISGTGGDQLKTPQGIYVVHSNYTDLVYSQADALCKISGGQIAAFETRSEFDILAPLLPLPNLMQYWLYANDKRNDGEF